MTLISPDEASAQLVSPCGAVIVCQETVGTIVDRSAETLGAADAAEA